MVKDCQRARARFIARSLDVRNQLEFADAQIILRVLQIFCEDGYGSLLWDLGSDAAESYFKCWNTNVKLVFGIQRNTFTYLAEGFFAENFTSLRNQVYCRYATFFRKLLDSPSREVQFLAHLVAKDPRSTSCRNLRLLENKTSLSRPFDFSSAKINSSLASQTVPEGERWRLGLLKNLFLLRSEKLARGESTQDICAMIDSLCNT